ncbi:hypothetical protein EK0264_02855 [Epidermidibacterium keratini]|uniref:PQQ-binding-like beta-propeller repeat protein n=1 Tax=Epidermidibacterium keratini TaxID=1891644 RepID=A0A7L4YKI4_9ACTN|nr:hypothetical protein [Epidermidibacterium keratini]QHB99328.1 hypothetical protein EK0264_02855 [Epidermidibacterium keratini]
MGAHQGKLLAGLLAFVMLMAGCTSSKPTANLQISESARAQFQLATLVTEPVEPEWTVPLTPVGTGAIRVDDTLLVYAYDGSTTYLQAIDAESGTLLWTAPATPGGSGNSREWTPVVTRTSQGVPVTLLAPPPIQRPDGDWAHPLEARDVRTGAVLGAPSPAWVALVGQCELEICMQVNTNDSTWYYATFNADTFEIELDERRADDGISDGWRIGDNMHLHLDDDKLEWYVDGEMAWETPLSVQLPDGVTPGDFASGFTFQVSVDDPFAPTVVGLSFQGVGAGQSNGAFAFSVEDGTPLWSKCDFEFCAAAAGVQCPLGMQSLLLSEDPPIGTYSYAGIDMQTGERLWEKTFESVDLQAPNSAPPGFLLLVDGGVPRYIDVATGDELSLSTKPTMGCEYAATWTGFEGSKPTNPTVKFDTGYTYSTCDLAGVATVEPASRSVVTLGSEGAWRDGRLYAAGRTLGTPVEDPLDDAMAWYYVQTPTGIAAYRF